MRNSYITSALVLILIFKTMVFAPALRASDPMVTLSAADLKFGMQPQGTRSAPQTVVLSNIGQADLTIASITLSGENSGDFAESSDCPMLPEVLTPSRSCQLRLLFYPHTAVTDLTATVSISDNAPGNPHTITLHGTPAPAASGITLTPASLRFASQAVATVSAAHSVLIYNSGSVTLNIVSAASLSGSDHSEFRLQRTATACPDGSGQLAPKESCEFAVIFAPSTAGEKSAQIVIQDDAPGSPHVVTLSATAVAQ
jgi:hypothetical protein